MSATRHQSRGQVLVMFVLFLLVLLGISALAIDYASWLLVDRNLQNVADHASLAGASEFDDRTSQGSCSSGPGLVQCVDARAQAWTSVSDELGLGLSPAAIAQLSLSNSPTAGITTITAGPDTFTWQDRVWVSTPPPNDDEYLAFEGRYARNYGVVFVRVDRDVRSFLGGAIGIQPGPRAGWATAGALPTDFALQLFCRNHIAPESGVCVNSAALTIDGQGGIRLLRGDIGSNESLKVTANTGSGVVLDSGNMFLVNGSCAPSTWNCPNSPPQGGISDGVNGKNAFYIAPLPVPQYESPINGNTVSAWDCSGADATHLCVPNKNQDSSSTGSPGDWTCSTSSNTPVRCGTPTVTPGSVTCIGQGGGNPPTHYYAIATAPSSVNADAAHPQNNANKYRNIDDDVAVPEPDTAATPANPPTDYLWINDINNPGAGSTDSFTANLGQSGPRLPGSSTVRYVVFKTDGGVPNNTQNPVSVVVKLLNGSGTILATDVSYALNDIPARYEFTVGNGVIPAGDFNSLRLQFNFTSSGSSASADERGGGVSWAEIEHPGPQPATPPMIPPGRYQSIEIPSGACAILDPTAEYSSLKDYQMPGIYQFSGSGNGHTVHLQNGSYLIGDGVTFVFDSDWPDSGSQRGLTIDADAALVVNTMRVPGVPPCTPSETEPLTVNQSDPLSPLPYSAVCAAWGIDTTVQIGVRPGANAWHYCDPANPDNASHCVIRDSYAPSSIYRGITFYFTPDPGWSTAHASMNIRNRFEMQGGVGGLAFRGVLYAPYDDVSIQGGNGFDTVGQVKAWTAKFNGGSAFIKLDYPYDFTPAAPYLLEPTIDH